MKRKITLFRLTIVIAVLASVGIAMAVVTPPPANQELGIYDTLYSGFDEAGCRGCHSSGVPDTHHMLIVEAGYACTDCHPPGPNGGVTAIRDCVFCHDSSPHHITAAALDHHCSECHGSFVDDYDDGHYIPDYEPSLITPEPGCKPDATNDTTDKKWGGCLACHEPDPAMHPVIDSNRDTHHSAVGGKSCGVGICHAVTGTEPPIRGCEACHGVNSIHNIQYDYENTKGVAGYGHIGETWDCIGCHGWLEYKVPRSPTAEIVVPSTSAIIPSSLVTGEETEVTIVGSNFVTTSDGTTYTSNVVIEDEDGVTITMEPDTITATEITVTIPGLATGNYGVYLLKAGRKSNKVPIPVAPEVSIESATVDANGTVTVIGKGFGKVNPNEYDDRLGIGPVKTDSIKVKKIVEEPEVKEWGDTRIVFSTAEAREKGARFDIMTPFGSRKSVPITKPTP